MRKSRLAHQEAHNANVDWYAHTEHHEWVPDDSDPFPSFPLRILNNLKEPKSAFSQHAEKQQECDNESACLQDAECFDSFDLPSREALL
jgi:hypothetical protein